MLDLIIIPKLSAGSRLSVSPLMWREAQRDNGGPFGRFRKRTTALQLVDVSGTVE